LAVLYYKAGLSEQQTLINNGRTL